MPPNKPFHILSHRSLKVQSYPIQSYGRSLWHVLRWLTLYKKANMNEGIFYVLSIYVKVFCQFALHMCHCMIHTEIWYTTPFFSDGVIGPFG